jgi:hypothetical protein
MSFAIPSAISLAAAAGAVLSALIYAGWKLWHRELKSAARTTVIISWGEEELFTSFGNAGPRRTSHRAQGHGEMKPVFIRYPDGRLHVQSPPSPEVHAGDLIHISVDATGSVRVDVETVPHWNRRTRAEEQLS